MPKQVSGAIADDQGMAAKPIRLATRGSELARAQAQWVADELAARRYEVELVEYETTGDRVRDELIHRLGKTGAFVRTLDERVLDGDVEGAVHSLKDMPTDMPPELVVAAVPERTYPGDLLVSPEGLALEALSDGARVGTASLRRGAQLRAERPDLEIVPIRGNVDTRLEKLLAPSLERRRAAVAAAAADDDAAEANEDEEVSLADWRAERNDIELRALGRDVEEELDALVLAEAGLERAGLRSQVGTTALPPDRFVPAPGQGALALTMRDTDLAGELQRYLDHPPTRVEVTVERTILGELGAGCIAPIGISAALQGDIVATRVQVLSRDGTEVISVTEELPVERHAAAAAELASELEAQGARELIEQARRDAGGSGGMRAEE